MSELKNVVVDALSLVKRGANGEPLQIYKSADPNDRPDKTPVKKAEATKTTEPEVTEKAQTEETNNTAESMDEAIQKSTHKALKDLFAPILKAFTPDIVEKAADIDNHVDYTSFLSRISNPEMRLDDALDQLTYTVWNIFWDDSITNGKELILKNIDDFKVYVEKVLNGDRSLQSIFFEKGDLEEMKKEDVTSAVTEALAPLAKSIGDLADKVTVLEKSATEEVPAEAEAPAAATAEDTTVEKSAEKTEASDLAAIVKSAIEASMQPISKSVKELTDRVATIETLKGVSKSAEVTEVKKSDGVADEWPEFNLGL